MAVTYTSSVKNYRLQVGVDQIDAKAVAPSTTTPGAAGNLVIGTASLAGGTAGVLVTVPLSLPSFSISGGVATLAGTPLSVTNPAATGTAALAEFRTGSSVVIISALVVGTSGTSDIVVNTVTVSTGVPFSVTSGTITSG